MEEDEPDREQTKQKKQEKPERQYDLKERTARFGEAIIRFAKKIPRSPVSAPLITQLVKAGTSVGANYHEADDAVSRKDFRNKVGISRKEASESKFFLRMVAVSEPPLKEEARELWKEADALHKILAKSFETAGRPIDT